jgi:hypothetical protein
MNWIKLAVATLTVVWLCNMDTLSKAKCATNQSVNLTKQDFILSPGCTDVGLDGITLVAPPNVLKTYTGILEDFPWNIPKKN